MEGSSLSILDELNHDMKAAMKAKDRETLATIRMLKSALQNKKLAEGELSTEDELQILAKEKKQRVQSVEEFEAAGREDLVEKTQKEIEVVDKYLPKQLTEDEIQAIVKQTIEEVGASSMKDMGKVMPAVMEKVQGQADGGAVSSLVKQELNK